MLNKISLLGFYLLLCVALGGETVCQVETALHSLELASSSSKDQKKYNLAICAIFKNEAQWFKEWIEYHRLVGVEHFYLYNNGSTDHFLEVLNPYILEGVITIIDWPDQKRDQWKDEEFSWVKTTQVSAYEHGCTISALQNTKWLALIDVDEFMVPVNAHTMTELLDHYSDASAITLLWHLFGTSNVETLPENTLLIEALHKTCELDSPFHTIVKKTIIKPEYYDGFSLPPHNCKLKPGGVEISLSKNEAQLNHYMNRTIEYFNTCKIKNKENMDNIKLAEHEINFWRNMGNQIDDENLYIHRYIPALRKQMGFTIQETENALKEDKAPIKPLVSIITSVWDGDAFIESFLLDITQQTIFTDCELILINANSPGNEEAIIKKYMSLYPNIRYVKLKQDPGLYGVLNIGLKMSAADLITKINVEDRCHPHLLALQLFALKAMPDIDLVYTGYYINPFPNETFENNQHTVQVDAPLEELISSHLREYLPGPQPMWRKTMHDRYGFFDETFLVFGDWEMWNRAISQGAKFKKIPGIYGLIYQNSTALTRDREKILQRQKEANRI